MADARKLARLHRVRTLQLGLTRADEVRAQERLANETQLSSRIAALAAGVAPEAASSAPGFSLGAAAHYRERLYRSAADAAGRVRDAQAFADRAAAASREAKRDQTAVEKLMTRAAADALTREMRALEEAPPGGRRVRHDPC
jgi:hypothetical protein